MAALAVAARLTGANVAQPLSSTSISAATHPQRMPNHRCGKPESKGGTGMVLALVDGWI